MQITNFISNLAMPMIILLIVIYGVKEKTKFLILFRWSKRGNRNYF